MKKLKLSILALVAVAFFAAVPFSHVDAQGSGGSCNTGKFLTFPYWWDGLDMGKNCTPEFGDNPERAFMIITTNVVEIILQVVGYACVIFMLTGGFYYMTSAGSPEQASRGMKTIRNASIGLVISLMSVGIVNLVASGLTG